MIKTDDTVTYIGTAEELVAIYLEDTPVQEFHEMRVFYATQEEVTTYSGYKFPVGLLERVV